MSLNFEPDCREAIELAKKSTPEDGFLDVETLLAALYHHGTEMKEMFPSLEELLQPPQALRDNAADQVPLAPPLRSIMSRLSKNEQLITKKLLFKTLVESEEGQRFLLSQGMAEGLGKDIGARLTPSSNWRESPQRIRVISTLSTFGRMLTESAPPHGGVVMQDAIIKSLVRTLSKMKRRNAIIIGHPGTGKSAIVYELARRLLAGDKSIPPKLRDMDIFELSPSFLRSGASFVGQYDERVKTLLQTLKDHPKIVLFVDEIHSLFQSGIHERGPFTDANESFKGALGRGEITCIGCTTHAEYRRYIEPDKALERRFNVIRLNPPSTETTVAILEARRPKMEKYYHPLTIPDDILKKAVQITNEHLPSRFQPDKAIQLLDDACALCVTSDPPSDTVQESALLEALRDMVGHEPLTPGLFTQQAVLKALQSCIVGQDTVLERLSRAFVAALSEWNDSPQPRGVFLLGGPTGVGKTQTAVALSKLLGQGKEMLIRVDCNTLSASEHDASPAMHRLIGTPPGYVGYARGQGGILSRIRDMPECIVLFDEFEKTPPGIGEFLLQILDEGRVEDVDGNILDFGRAFIFFTTNVGCVYERHRMGFENALSAPAPRVNEDSIKKGLRNIGLGDEFLGRIHHFFVFNDLDENAIPIILMRQLKTLQEAAELRRMQLLWSDDVIGFLASEWQPRFGVRFLDTILRHRINEQIGMADAQGELIGIETIRLEVKNKDENDSCPSSSFWLPSRKREGNTLFIYLK